MARNCAKAAIFGFVLAAAAVPAALAKDNPPPKTQDLLDQCGSRPVAPVVPGAETLDKQKLSFVKKDVQAFLADADKYQDCLAKVIEAPGLTEGQKSQINRIEDQVQSEKEIIGGQYNRMVDAVYSGSGASAKPAATPVSGGTAQPAAAPASGPTNPPARPTGTAVPKAKPAEPAQ